MGNDFGWPLGRGIGVFLLVTALYLGFLALTIWIGYLLMRTAVKNGVILAMRETGQQFPPGGFRPGMPPAGPSSAPYPGAPGGAPPRS